ncbi:hypothetical protein LJR078_002377 [Arthrobacter sp. LjRoot78]|uniref:hypothetical protein n=1 Tax=Arthrobacter sp. LjRoot78 TaxID=3342338 RepID=UPI003ECD241A
MSGVWLVSYVGNLLDARRIQKIRVGSGDQNRNLLAQLACASGYELIFFFDAYEKGIHPDKLRLLQAAEARSARLELVVALDDARRLATTLDEPHTVSYAKHEKRWLINNLVKQGIRKPIGDV